MTKIKRVYGTLAIILLFYRYDFKNILKQVKGNLLLFFIVCTIMCSEVWVPYLLGIIFQNQWLIHIGNVCWIFWLGPGPFLPLCIGITLAIAKLRRKR